MKNKLFIPQNVKIKKELFNGFDNKAVKNTLLLLPFILIISIILFSVENIYGVMAFMILFSAVVMLQIKDSSNLNVFEIVAILINYTKRQKKYMYIYDYKELKNNENIKK